MGNVNRDGGERSKEAVRHRRGAPRRVASSVPSFSASGVREALGQEVSRRLVPETQSPCGEGRTGSPSPVLARLEFPSPTPVLLERGPFTLSDAAAALLHARTHLRRAQVCTRDAPNGPAEQPSTAPPRRPFSSSAASSSLRSVASHVRIRDTRPCSQPQRCTSTTSMSPTAAVPRDKPPRKSSTKGKRLRPNPEPLPKGASCQTCRTRKVRCDAGKPGAFTRLSRSVLLRPRGRPRSSLR